MPRKSINQVRIIGGSHRGRKLEFPPVPGLRPTGDRVRETLFNWLRPYVQGARCLDLFAGSGALGIEAASRGAREVVMLDNTPQVIKQLEQNIQSLGLNQVKVIMADAMHWLDTDATPFDLVFLDPPFTAGLLSIACEKLELHDWLSEQAMIYLEDDVGGTFTGLPKGWKLIKEKQAGQVRFGLAQH